MAEFEMTEKMIELAEETIKKADEYFHEFAKTHGKKGYVWIKQNDTKQLVVYTRGEYTDKILKFLSTLT
jgi:hypothetical protein